MATATTTPVSSKVSYPAEAVNRLFAPPEREVPADKLRRLLHEARDQKSFLHTAGAYDAFTSAIMTTLGFKTLYGSGWQLAATKSMYPDIGIYQSHQMVELVLEIKKGIEGARNTRWYDSEGKDLIDAPPAFVDMEAGFRRTDPDLHPGDRAHSRRRRRRAPREPGPRRTAPAATSSTSASRSGTRCWSRGSSGWPSSRRSRPPPRPRASMSSIIARTDSIDGALPDQELGRREDGDRGCVGSRRARRGRDLAGIQQHRARAAAGILRGRSQVLPQPDAGLQPLALALLRKGQESRHADHQPAARRPGLHPAVLDAVQLPDGRAWRSRRDCASS